MSRISSRLLSLIFATTGALVAFGGETPAGGAEGKLPPWVSRVDPLTDPHVFERSAFSFFRFVEGLEQEAKGAGVSYITQSLKLESYKAHEYVQGVRRALAQYRTSDEKLRNSMCEKRNNPLLGREMASAVEAAEASEEQLEIELVREFHAALDSSSRLLSEVYISKVIQPGFGRLRTDYRKLFKPDEDYSNFLGEQCDEFLRNDKR